MIIIVAFVEASEHEASTSGRGPIAGPSGMNGEMKSESGTVGKNVNMKTGDKKAEKRKAVAPLSIQDDKNATPAYKSLFTTCEEAKRKPEPHWITHNPLFY